MGEETRGRKKKFSIDILRYILQKYLSEDTTGSITASKLASYANDMGYSEIKYYHFTRYKDELKDIFDFSSNVGRGQKYTTNDLKEIVEDYLTNCDDGTAITITNLVSYAKQLGYKDITSYYFTKDSYIQNLIKSLNKDTVLLKNDDDEKNFYFQHGSNLNADLLVDNYKSKPKILKAILRQYSSDYNELKGEHLRVKAKLKKANEDIANLKKIEAQYNALKNERDYYKKEYERILKYDSLHDKIYMLERLSEHGVKVNISEDSLNSLIDGNKKSINDNININLEENTLIHKEKSNVDNVINISDKKQNDIKNGLDFLGL